MDIMFKNKINTLLPFVGCVAEDAKNALKRMAKNV
jgi:hypothetical protein